MTVIVNGKSAEVSGEISVTRLLEEVKAQDPLYVTVQLNGRILKSDELPTTIVKANDELEFLYFMGGGSLTLSLELREQMLAHAKAALPNEGCGLFAGELDAAGAKTARAVYCLTNLDASPEHFSMEPKEQFAAIADMRKQGLTLLGNFHSHPSTPARPSAEDIRLAFDPALSYVIISLAESEPRLQSFIVDKQRNVATEEELRVA
jgi:thiamine biosynthesis protein ThiS